MPPEPEKRNTEAPIPSGTGASEAGSAVESYGAHLVDAGDGRRSAGPWALAWRRLRRNKVALFSLGVFLLIASRDPQAHRSLIWFTVWSSVVHGGIMAVQSVPAAPGA